MDITSMLARENFFELFPPTVEAYFRDAEHKTVHIKRVQRAEPCNLVVKPKLSALMPPHISKKAQSFFYSEWNPRCGFLKYAAVRLYVFAMMHSGRLFSQYWFSMQPEQAVGKDLVIAPNNRSIRFFHYKTGTVGCVVKDGFSDRYFQNQLQFRLKYDYPFLLPMMRWGDRWFVEPILEGHPLARVTDRKSYQKGLRDALDGIRQLASDTLCYEDFRQYLTRLERQVLIQLETAKQTKHIASYSQTEQLVAQIRGLTQSLPKQIPVCTGHGDLQTGNIWVDKQGKTLIYDWETVGVRSIWYDSAVLQYALRRENGWHSFLTDLSAAGAFLTSPSLRSEQPAPSAVKCTVMLEDILFRLEDMLELPQDWGAEIYDTYIMNLFQTVTEDGIT